MLLLPVETQLPPTRAVKPNRRRRYAYEPSVWLCFLACPFLCLDVPIVWVKFIASSPLFACLALMICDYRNSYVSSTAILSYVPMCCRCCLAGCDSPDQSTSKTGVVRPLLEPSAS